MLYGNLQGYVKRGHSIGPNTGPVSRGCLEQIAQTCR